MQKTISESVLGKLTQFWSISVLKFFFSCKYLGLAWCPRCLQMSKHFFHCIMWSFSLSLSALAELHGSKAVWGLGPSCGVALLWWSNGRLALRKVRMLPAREPGGALKTCVRAHTLVCFVFSQMGQGIWAGSGLLGFRFKQETKWSGFLHIAH